MTRFESLLLAYVLVAILSWSPFTAMMGGLTGDRERTADRLMIAWQIALFLLFLLAWFS